MSNTREHKSIEVEKLTLDTENPRIQKIVEMYAGGITPEALGLALGSGLDDVDSREAGTTFYTLKAAIKTNGGIIQPIHVNETPNGALTVIEGNTRVRIYQELKQEGVEGDWSKIPAILYSDLSQEEIDSIRLQSHQVGPRAWDPYHKAKYLFKLNSQQDMPFSRLVDLCGGRKSDVTHYINAYNDMEEYYRNILDDETDFDTTRFSAFIELQKSNVKESILRAQFSFEDFAEWVAERKIDPLNTVRKLPRILANKEAKKIFLDKGAKPAIHYLDEQQLAPKKLDGNLFDLCQAVKSKIEQISWSEVQKLKSDREGEKVNTLLDLSEELERLINDINNDIND